jgi:hypothetical protein
VKTRPDVRSRGLDFRFGSLRFYLVFGIVTAVLLALDSFLSSIPFSAAMPGPQEMIEFQKKQIETWASWLWSAASLYFGYLSYQQVTWMLGAGFFDSHNSRLWWPSRAQFWSFLISVVIFADFVYGSVRDKEKPA